MKNTLQELIDWIKEHRDNNKILMQQHVIAKGYELLEKQKQQSLDLIRFVRLNDKMGKSAEDLYNEFINQ